MHSNKTMLAAAAATASMNIDGPFEVDLFWSGVVGPVIIAHRDLQLAIIFNYLL